MSQPKRAKAAKKAPAGEVPCRRVQRTFRPEEHRDCPYCFGTEADVKSGEHAKFCDFHPGEDPICFGFPQNFGRYRAV